MKQRYELMIGIAVVLVAILIVGIASQQPKTGLPNIQVVYSVSGGLLRDFERLTITNDGLVTLEEQKPFELATSTKFVQLSSTEVQEFKRVINDANVLGLNYSAYDKYCNPDCPTDIPLTSITFTIGSKEKTISMYALSNMPELKQVLEQIQAIEQKFK